MIYSSYDSLYVFVGNIAYFSPFQYQAVFNVAMSFLGVSCHANKKVSKE